MSSHFWEHPLQQANGCSSSEVTITRQNIIYEAGQVVSITPLHEGVEPGTAFTYNGTTYANPLITEKTAMQEMLGSFTAAELASAKISGTFSDCLLIPGSTTNTFPVTKQGIKASSPEYCGSS